MSERARFVVMHDERIYTMTELCERFSISRKTGYKWLERHLEGGVLGLADQSRAPQSCPHRTSAAVEAALVEARKQHPHWGPKKLVPYLARKQPELALPAPSTAGEVLKRHGLVKAGRPRRRPPVHPGSGPLQVDAANQVWSADFKGEFLTRSGVLCYPLTVTDNHSRFLLACHCLPTTASEGTKPVFAALFAEYGLPIAIRTDNGTPFSSRAISGLSRLSVEWTKLGILHQRITPAHPEENGRHERMHRTLKAETTRPPEWDLARQQERSDRFRHEYNTERPHEALAQETPASHYSASCRRLPEHVPRPEYAGHLQLRRVGSNGIIKFRSLEVFVSEVLSGEEVALEEIDEGLWSVYFYRLLVGRFDERSGRMG